MDETKIREYAGLMQELGLTGLEITMHDGRVRLERTMQAPAATTVLTMPNPVAAMPAAQAGDAPQVDAWTGAALAGMAQGHSSAAVGADAARSAANNCHNVTSPIVGVFYAAPAENAEPYVKVGDHVTKGQMLCIVEAMKLMNEITSDVTGTVEEICVTDSQVVEYGTVLFRIRREP